MTEWQPIETAPKDGTTVKLNHSLSAPGYETTGRFVDGKWEMAWFFITPKMMMIMYPDQWAPPLSEENHD